MSFFILSDSNFDDDVDCCFFNREWTQINANLRFPNFIRVQLAFIRGSFSQFPLCNRGYRLNGSGETD